MIKTYNSAERQAGTRLVGFNIIKSGKRFQAKRVRLRNNIFSRLRQRLFRQRVDSSNLVKKSVRVDNVIIESVNLVNDKPVTFADFKFDTDKVRSMFSNFSFNNSRPITKSMISWWAYQDENQELLPLETVLEIEHIYARSRQDKEQSLKDIHNLEALGNKALLEKRINIRAADYRFEDKKKYYTGFTNSRNQVKEGTKIKELINLANSSSDFTEVDIEKRTKDIMDRFIGFLSENELTR